MNVDGVRGANSFDEWTRLREVVVGAPEGYAFHEVDSSFRLFYFDNVAPDAAKLEAAPHHPAPRIRIPPRLVEELAEDVAEFVETLRSAGVIVHRPSPLSHDAKRAAVTSPFWSATETPPLNVRDQSIVLGSTIVETAPHIRGRVFENDYLKPVFQRYFNAGSRWLSMPRPALAQGSLDPSFFADAWTELHDEAKPLAEVGFEMVFDGAQCIRFGRDILVNVGNANHELGFSWLVREFGETFRLHKLDGLADSHIDSLVVPLRPGVLMVRSHAALAHLPEPLSTWKVIVPPESAEDQFPDYSDFGFNIASRYIDINVLSIDENTVVVNSLCPDLIRTLEKHDFEVVPVRHRHRRLFGGGFHCFTLDTVRDGGLTDYFEG